MKKISIYTLMLLLTAKCFCQQIDTLATSRQSALLLKSKSQKSSGWLLLGGGSALVLGGLLLGNRNNSSFSEAGTGAILGALGVLSAIGSIPLFTASARNRRRAERTVSLEVGNINHMQLAARQTAASSFGQLKLKIAF